MKSWERRFSRERADFSRETHARTRACLTFSYRYFHSAPIATPRDRIINREGRKFRDHFSLGRITLAKKYRTERNETRARHTEEVECEGEGGKNSNVHSAVHVVYVHSFVFFHSHLLYPTLTQPTSRGLFQGLLLLGFSCQPLKRNLPFGHCHFCTIRSYAQASTSSYHRVFSSFPRLEKDFKVFIPLETIRLWMNIQISYVETTWNSALLFEIPEK